MSKPMLAVDLVSKSFVAVRALDRASLQIAPGERVALLGHNGAGKTTLFRLILGFIRADAGALAIDGHAPGTDAARRIVSYLPETVAFPKTLTGREIIRFYARLKGATRGQADQALERVGLAAAAGRRVGAYSKGMRQRLGLAQALVGAPRLVLLDEPTSGLDPMSRRDFYTIVDEVAAAGAAVLLSSHVLSELEAKTDRIAILRAGRMVADAPLAALQAKAALPVRIRVRTRDGDVDEVGARLGGRRVNGRSIEFLCGAPEKMARLADISDLGPLIVDVDVEPSSLDDVYHWFSTRPDAERPS